MIKEIDKLTKWDSLSISILIFSVILILFSFFSPLIFTNHQISEFQFSDTGQIGDTLSGLMNPFIGIAGVFLTFLAFYIQFKANKLQRTQFKLELTQQQSQFKKSQFENQFYEMLRLHKENVNEIRITNPKKGYDLTGRQVFELFKLEFEVCYHIARKSFPDESIKTCVNEAYGVFFHGIHEKNLDQHAYFGILYKVKSVHEKENYTSLPQWAGHFADVNITFNLDFPLFMGYSSQLAHYYRHLFQTVKFIASQETSFLTYEEKRKYLRILRAQLSNPEQTMIFYNWYSGFGKQWENNVNKFFTDYRMIHNLYQALLLSDIKLEDLFDINGDYLKEKDKEKDYLFEYQDWE
jgi:hypothetical protein